jgi:hypothetical protein
MLLHLQRLNEKAGEEYYAGKGKDGPLDHERQEGKTGYKPGAAWAEANSTAGEEHI